MESTFGVTYAVGNDVFAAKCFILGWTAWSYGCDPEPIAGLNKDQAGYLREIYVGPLYPDDLKKAIQDRLDAIDKEAAAEAGALTELTENNRYADSSKERSPSPVKFPDPEK